MKVGLFVTCLVDLMRPSIGFAAIRLLEHGGCEVFVPAAQTCCGQPGYNSGERAAAKGLALKVLDEFESCDYLVAPSGSCSGMIRTHYPDLLSDEPGTADRLARLTRKTFELTDFLVSVLKLETLPGTFSGKVAYHDSCSSLREMGVKQQPRRLLEKVPGVQLAEMAECETCCGFGGSFSVKFGEISSRLADNKCQNIEDSGADAVVLGDLGCMLNIEGRLHRRGKTGIRVLHVAEVLAGIHRQ